MNLLDEAYARHEEGLEILRSCLGTEHLDVARGLDHMAFVFERMGRFRDALTQHQESLAIRVKIVGRTHQDVANSLGNIGHIYCSSHSHASFLLFHPLHYSAGS